MQELFETRNGRVIMDEDLSSKMYLIKQYHPEKADETSSGFEWSEMGMANLFGLLYSHEARYCPEHKSWYTYHEGAWRKDEGAILVSEKIKDFVRLMILYCGEIDDDDTRKSYTGFVNKMGDRRMRDRILKDATGELRISAVQFDADPYLINCLNGTYDLRDFSFREHSWNDFLTMQTAFSHTISKTVKCKRWETFIKEVTQNDEDKADFLQRALGYSMLGMSNEECMFILHGKTTRNGKSTLLKMIVGESAPDDGNVILTKGKTLGYLAQHQEMQSGNTIYEEVRTAKADIIAMERRIREIEMELKHLSGDALNDRLETYNRLTAAFERENGYSCESEITGVLKGLGFTENDFTKPVDTLSGGQKTRVSLGKLLLTKPDILLLDEPTNQDRKSVV